jgi:hypothetical protein
MKTLSSGLVVAASLSAAGSMPAVAMPRVTLPW